VNQPVEDIFQLIGNVLLIWAAVMATLSVILHARVPWRRSEMGRHLMAYMGVMAAVLVLGVIRIFIGDSPWFQLIRLVTFIGVPIAMTWRVWLQIKAQRGDADS
jgi:hypothetical protein